MAGGSSLSVVAGLAVGIAFIILFSIAPRLDFLLSDREIISKYSNLPEVRYFLDKYPDAKAEVDRSHSERYIWVSFTVEEQVTPPSGLDTGIHVLTVSVLGRPFQPVLEISCGLDGMTGSGPLQSIEAIDSTEQWCFQSSGAEPARVIEVSYPGGRVGLFHFTPIQPEAIFDYPFLQDMMKEAKINDREIVSADIPASQAETLVADSRFHFDRICFDGGGACSDELGSFVELGEDTREYYVIRILDKVEPDNQQAETGAFNEENAGRSVPVEVANDDGTSVEITYKDQ